MSDRRPGQLDGKSIQLPLAPDVTLKMPWSDLFGSRPSDMDEPARRQRWERWKEIARASGNEDSAEQWECTDGCHGDGDEPNTCKHLDGDWCKYSGLPASVNPYLTLRHGVMGMACMGMGYTPTEPGESA